MNKAIVVMLDDVLNNFSDMLHDMGVRYNGKSQSISERRFISVFYTREGTLTPAAEKAMGEAVPRQDGIAFLDWLKDNGWTVVICTNRDIRLAYDITKKWLDGHQVKFDYLFTATAPAGFCIDMDIPFMVYNLPEGAENHINAVSFREAEPDGQKEPFLLGDFQNFEEVKQCIQKVSF